MSVFDVILGNRTRDELSLIALAIAGLVELDSATTPSSPGLLCTLESYLRHNGQLESATAELGIHRHTLRNRIAKIAEATRRELGSADDRAQLLLAIRAHELLKIDSSPL
jgi:purine catabolism regulator